ncbi:MAG TPA: pitrilysin family protein, partial [Gemmatimonadales bacterium]|nr:pitrilysin family protein [Gemmatimonadales bacterium]
AQFLTEGTRSRSSEQIAQLVSDLGALGAAISVNTDARETVLGVSVLPEAAPAMMELLADLVRRPAFQAAALERLKANAVRRLQLQRTQADWLASSRTNSLLFPGDVADRVPSDEQVQSIDAAAVTAFHTTYYAPSRARLYVAGTFDQAAVERAATAAFADWPRGGGSAPSFRLPGSAKPRVTTAGDRPVIHLIDRPGATQARVQVSFPVVDMAHPDHRVLNEINMLMGSTQTARLIANIRERHGYSYNISSRLARRPRATQWMVTGDVTNNVVGPAIQEILGEIARLRREAPPAPELQSFQAFMAGILVSENSTAQGILESLRWMDLYGVGTNYLGTFIQNVYTVTPANIQATANRYLRPARMTIVVVGDRKTLLPQLEAIARVE